MKKGFAIILSLCLLMSLLCVSVSAREESEVTPLWDCDDAFGSFTVDRQEYTEGKGSLSLTLGGASFANSCTIDEEDLSEADTLAFDLYIPNEDLLDSFTQFFAEISSSDTCDEEELQWEFLGTLRGYPVQEGWNTVYLYFDVATEAGECDLSAINYFRIYAFYGTGAAGQKIKIDHIRACYTGGEDFSDMELKAYQGDNADAEVVISGQSEPNPDQRHTEVTINAGLSANAGVEDGSDATDENDGSNEAEGNSTDAANDEGGLPAYLIPIIAAVVIAVVAVVLALVLKRKKKV